jgi:hypothetical protein
MLLFGAVEADPDNARLPAGGSYDAAEQFDRAAAEY